MEVGWTEYKSKGSIRKEKATINNAVKNDSRKSKFSSARGNKLWRTAGIVDNQETTRTNVRSYIKGTAKFLITESLSVQ